MDINCTFAVGNAKKLNFTTSTQLSDVMDFIYVASADGKKSHLVSGIRSVLGVHTVGKSDNDVKLFILSNFAMDIIPLGINTNFSQLTQLVIKNCWLKDISRKSLIGLEKLTHLAIIATPITTLPKDLIVDMTRLLYFSVRSTQLQFIDSGMLTLMENELITVDLRLNPTINVYYSKYTAPGFVSFAQLIAAIDNNCKKPDLKLSVDVASFAQCHEKLWNSDMLSDFVVVTDVTEFKVHKVILACGSPVFAAMFAANMQEQQDNRMIIKDFSSVDVQDFLKFFYFGRVARSINAVEVFKLAEKYDVEDLRYLCESILLHTVQETNAVEILELGIMYNYDVLKNVAFKVIKNALPGKDVLPHWIDEPERLRKIMDTKQYFDKLFVEPSGS